MSPDLELVLCHHPRTNLVPWVDGEAGYVFTGNSRDHRVAVFVREDSLTTAQLVQEEREARAADELRRYDQG